MSSAQDMTTTNVTNDNAMSDFTEINSEFNEYLEYYWHLLRKQYCTKVLIVEDDPISAKIIEAAVYEFNPDIRCFFATTEKEALQVMQTVPCDLVVADYFLEGGHTGLHLCNKIQSEYEDTKCMIVSSLRNDQYQEISRHSPSAPDFLQKPISNTQFKNYLFELLGGHYAS